MREIKFRVWDVERKSWMNEQDVYNEVQEQGRWNPERGQFYKLMQFTGLRDKNGKEIFEGDIIQWNGYEVQNGKQIRPIRKRAIGMTVDAFRNSFIDDCFHLQNLLRQGLNIEVIGNVHENPELIA